jgi:hypothetical protein
MWRLGNMAAASLLPVRHSTLVSQPEHMENQAQFR